MGATAGVHEPKNCMISPNVKTLGVAVLMASLIACGDDDPTGPGHRYTFTADQPSISIKNYERVPFSTTLMNETLGAKEAHDFIAWSLNDAVATTSRVTVNKVPTWHVTGRSPGNASIVVAWSGLQDTIAVTIAPNPVTSVAIVQNDTTSYADKTVAFTATLKNAGGDVLVGPVRAWSSSDTTIAKVSATGVVTARSQTTAGTVEITLTSEGVTDTREVVFAVRPIKSVEIDEGETDVVDLTGTLKLDLTVVGEGDVAVTGRTVAWTSSDPAVATVDKNGVVTGLTEGNVTITATVGGESGTTNLKVLRPVTSVAVSAAGDAKSLNVAGTLQLTEAVIGWGNIPVTGRDVAWTSSDDAIATVDAAGIVTGVAAGDVTITATVGGVAGTISLKIIMPVKSVEVSAADDAETVEVGATLQLSETVLGLDDKELTGREVTWTSSNEAFATVDEDGVVTGVAAGAVTITATVEGKVGTIALTVEAAAP